MINKSIMPTLDQLSKLISRQFPEYADLPITDVEKQGHDNRTYRLGSDMLIRMLTAKTYALNYRSFSVHTLSCRRFFMSFQLRSESKKHIRE